MMIDLYSMQMSTRCVSPLSQTRNSSPLGKPHNMYSCIVCWAFFSLVAIQLLRFCLCKRRVEPPINIMAPLVLMLHLVGGAMVIPL